ncbi:MAG TPA: hypothetical protein GXX75_10550 [Clostridiales bacterium]|nr:hypothetical protein [Clostridiales bacterium]
MNLIERYVFAVTEHLDEGIRKDVADELTSNIEDMLPENPSGEDIRGVLEKMGNPHKLADEYKPVKRYLIGPTLFDSYISLLKLVIGIAVSVIVCITLLGWGFKPPQDYSYVKLITDLIVTAVDTAFQAAVWVTIIFAILERTGVNEGQLPFSKKSWTIDDLPPGEVPQSKKISRVETALSLFFTILFVSILYFRPNLIAIYIRENSNTQAIPLFSVERLGFYSTAIILIAIVQLLIIVWKFIQGKWNLPLAVANLVENAASCVLMILLLTDRHLLRPEFFNGLAAISSVSATRITDIWFRGTSQIIIIVFIIIIICDSISAFVKAKK